MSLLPWTQDTIKLHRVLFPIFDILTCTVVLWPHLLELVLATPPPIPNPGPGNRVDPSQGLHSCPFLKICFIAVSRPKAEQKAEMKSKWNKKKLGCTKEREKKLLSRSEKISTSSIS